MTTSEASSVSEAVAFDTWYTFSCHGLPNCEIDKTLTSMKGRGVYEPLCKCIACQALMEGWGMQKTVKASLQHGPRTPSQTLPHSIQAWGWGVGGEEGREGADMHGITFLSFSSPPHPPRSVHIYRFHVCVGAAGKNAGDGGNQIIGAQGRRK